MELYLYPYRSLHAVDRDIVYLRNTAMYLGIITDRHNRANSRLSQLLERPCEWVTYFTRINCDMHKNLPDILAEIWKIHSTETFEGET